MDVITNLYKYLPDKTINWDLINNEILKPYVDDLFNTSQEPKWHGEGNVLNHVIMVCEKLITLEEYQLLTKKEKLIVFLAALFHDIGKIKCSKINCGEITSFNHSVVGSIMIREHLWKEYNLAGIKKYQEFREAICMLIRYHSVPIHQYDDLTKKVIRLSLNSDLTPYFNINLLSILAKADVLGRIGNEYDEHLFNIELFVNEAIKHNCLNQSFKFYDSYTKYQYLNGNNIWPYQSLYDKTNGTIILVCGLPGTGKDTFIKNNYPNLDVISLDDIREEYKISPLGDQNEVYRIAKERAKEYLRKKKEFIWNATNLTNMIRNKQLNLFHDYNFKVKIVFLETDLCTNLLRNKSRDRIVAENIIYKLLSNINIPEAYEACDVEWHCI